jgi:predicted dithiol-disulfide oxidoreductase (DUF899 family)
MKPARTRFPNETPGYRTKRDALLKAEIGLRRQAEKVAGLRRKLPAGGVVPEDYVFQGEQGPVKLSELFTKGNTLVAYSFMFGPKMAQPCPMCTSMLDGLNGNARHVAQRTDLVVVARSPIERIAEFARSRSWSSLRLLSSENNSYNRDYHGESPEGAQWPMLNIFRKDKGKVRHFYATELLFAPSDKGQDSRHVDPIWPLWNLLDFTPEGRGGDWYPKLAY